MTWYEAMEYAKNLRLGGYSDWRLPTVDELEDVVRSCGGTCVEYGHNNWGTIVNNNKANTQYQNAYENNGFKSNDSYWSSTSVSGNIYDAWMVHFYCGSLNNVDKVYNNYYLRCVRVGQ